MPTPTFVSEKKLRARLVALLGKAGEEIDTDASQFDSTWLPLLESGNVRAYNTVVGVMVGRGYTFEQVTLWPRSPEFNEDLALYYALVDGGAGGKLSDDVFIEKLNRLEELMAAEVVIDGELVYPSIEPKAWEEVTYGYTP